MKRPTRTGLIALAKMHARNGNHPRAAELRKKADSIPEQRPLFALTNCN